MEIQLKSVLPSQLPPPTPGCRSDEIHHSEIPSDADPRDFYLDKVRAGDLVVPPPLISYSEFVPKKLVEHLMRKKKDSALGVKFIRLRSNSHRIEEITDSEGALNTFITPVVSRCEMVGDYKFDVGGSGHGVRLFGDVERKDGKPGKVRLTRSVVLSASVQMDFENPQVMFKATKLDPVEVVGADLGPDWEGIMSTEIKQEDGERRRYDGMLRRHMVFHLTSGRRLPAESNAREVFDLESSIRLLEDAIWRDGEVEIQLKDKYTRVHNNQVLSLEMLFNIALHQARNEFSALEALCPQGYVYTYDPASIFAREIGARILNRLMLNAVKQLSNKSQLENMRIFAFNDYADRSIVGLAAKALELQTNVRVVRKEQLFKGNGGTYDIGNFKEAEGCMLVVHNNSDGFGQNIETESVYGSLDGAIGSQSSGAASLERGRKDLLDFLC
jgi:hypothetical protein